MTNIFEYSIIFDPNIYSDICWYQKFDTNIFGYSFSCHFLDTNIFEYSFVSKSIRMSHSGLHLNCPTYFSITDVSDVLLSKFEVHCQQWNLSTLLKLRISWPHGIHTITPWIPVLRGTQSLDLSRACSSDLNRQKIRIQTTRQLIAVQEWSIPQAAAEGQYYCHNSTLAYTSCSFGLFRCLGLTHGMSLTCS